jgi:diacylglycerol O-acyltransferase
MEFTTKEGCGGVPMKPNRTQRLTFQDAAFANLDRDAFPMNVGSVGIYEDAIPFERFITHVERRIQLVPRYRQRLLSVPLGLHFAEWVDDPDFDVRRHVSSVALSPPGTDDQLAALASEFFATPLRRDQPLWEMRLVKGLSGGRTAHLAKVHHCMVDGVAGVGLLAALLDTTPETRYVRDRARNTVPLPGPVTLLTNAVFDRAIDQIRLNERIALGLLDWQRPAENARLIARALLAAGPYFAARAPKTPWNMPLHAPIRVAWAMIPFDEAHAAARALGGTVNDLALTVITEGLRRYLEQEGVETTDVVLRAGLPVSVRREGSEALGNRVSFMLAGLPVGVRDARERFARISAEVSDLKRQRQAYGIEQLMERLGDLPPIMHALTGRTLTMPNTLTNLICTNVPGPLQPLYLQGHRMLRHYPWVPIGWRMGLSVAIMSYDTGLYFSVTADRETPGDLTVITAGIGEAFEELRQAVLPTAPPQVGPTLPVSEVLATPDAESVESLMPVGASAAFPRA